MDELEEALSKAMGDFYLRAKTEAGYDAIYFLQMLSKHGLSRLLAA
jgi:hypothetical protein